MNPKNILVTGGCGFVGSSIALRLKKIYPEPRIIVIDNLVRKGSELNVPRLAAANIELIRGNVQDANTFSALNDIDLIIDCAAEPSVLAGKDNSPLPVLESNLWGTVNVLELARRTNAAVLYFSTSRVYPIEELSQINTTETDTRFDIHPEQSAPGITLEGVSEDFSLSTRRTLYGATKLASELLLHEYASLYNVRFIINRCGVIAGPWQFGKVDQGVAALWVARHVFGGVLSYIGFGGQGKQVRDFLHIDDLLEAVMYEIDHFDTLNGETFNIGGGAANAVSLAELTDLVQKISGKTIQITSNSQERFGDIKLYITDNTKFTTRTKWKPTRTVTTIIQDIYTWMNERQEDLKKLFTDQ